MKANNKKIQFIKWEFLNKKLDKQLGGKFSKMFRLPIEHKFSQQYQSTPFDIQLPLQPK